MARYQPASDFLIAVINEEAPLSGSIFGDANLRHLIAMTRDPDRSNRDWATFLVAQHDADDDVIRHALLRAASDDDEVVRAEAIIGLARRDRHLALPLIKQAFAAEYVSYPIFEAAAYVADPALVEDLRRFAAPSDDSTLDSMIAEALAACESGKPPEWCEKE
jgi:HEAT repeat protein